MTWVNEKDLYTVSDTKKGNIPKILYNFFSN